ncbi:hypothetical protein C5167_034631 [Papaver somniferum]|uniref:ULTRAPETALA1/2 SAND domain-containing protein n=1 Tax=Papaver somniferum TaxID=3469 RepID=A0A4Y7KHA1_PAPSO|nr:hypothetical protein C5167_034631 [Papaver somniferum]
MVVVVAVEEVIESILLHSRLKLLSVSERLEIKDKLTHAAFKKYFGQEIARKWKSNVWVIKKGLKVPLFKTVLLKYYDQGLKEANKSSIRSQKGWPCYQDKFYVVLY